MLGDAVAKLVSELPDDRRLRVLEIGAGTGSATASVLPELPEGRFEYIYTDISAGFFAEAEARFGGRERKHPIPFFGHRRGPNSARIRFAWLRYLDRVERATCNALSRRNVGSLSDVAFAGRTFDRVGKPSRTGLDGLDLRSIGRMVAFRRRV